MDSVTYKCPGCGSPLSFSIDKQLWACEFCRSEYTLRQLKDRPAPDAADRPETFHGEVVGYRCNNCGAEILAEKNTAATLCVYCKSPAILPTQLGDQVRKPNFILPFRVSKEAALEQLMKKIRYKPFVPRAVRQELKEGVISGLYVPFWLFSCDAHGRVEGEADQVTTWSDSDYRYTKTDTYRVVREAEMSIDRLPIDASDKMDDAVMHAIEPYNYSEIKEFEMQYLSGYYADSYDMTPQQAIPKGESRMDTAVDQTMRGTVGGYSSVRLGSTQIRKRNTLLQYAMMPVWTFVYRYREKTYTFTINGQTGKLVGKFPASAGRVLAWMGGMLALGIAAGAVAQLFV